MEKEMSKWEQVANDGKTERLAIPGGWLYRSLFTALTPGVAMTFVPNNDNAKFVSGIREVIKVLHDRYYDREKGPCKSERILRGLLHDNEYSESVMD